MVRYVKPNTVVGDGIFNLVTIAMYNNPLAIYREYIQNAVDAIYSNNGNVSGRVEIEIDASSMCVKIRDNGPGLSQKKVLRSLLPIAQSEKKRGTDCGFRGIGRLSGLAFAESVTFLTRSRRSANVSRVVWNGPKLQETIANTRQIETALKKSVVIDSIQTKSDEYPNHFFEVQITGVSRHVAGRILNQNAVEAYIAEVCPVPISSLFPYKSMVDSLFTEDKIPLTLEIFLNGSKNPVRRPYQNAIHYSDSKFSTFSDFEEIRIPSLDKTGLAAVGWIAHPSYIGSIPKDARIRGIRAREGNIQIGDERIFDKLFSEERFNRWCVGEVHILDPRIVPNGRRDYFEPGPHIRNLENHLSAKLNGIVTRCRRASSDRNIRRRMLSEIQRIKETYELASSGFLKSNDAKTLVEEAVFEISNIKAKLKIDNGYTENEFGNVQALESRLLDFKPKRGRPRFGGMSKLEVNTYRKILQALVRANQSPRVINEFIKSTLENYY